MNGPAGARLAVNVEGSDKISDLKSKIEDDIDCEVDRLVFGTVTLDEDETLGEAGLMPESNIEAFVNLDGGKRKRKKKVYTKPKKIGHKHKKRPLARLDYYAVDDTGKVKKLKEESPYCQPGTYMAAHADRHVCGLTGRTLFRLLANGERMPIPKQNKPQAAAAAAAPTKAAAKKKKK